MSKEAEMMKNLDEVLKRKIGRTKEHPTVDVVEVVRCRECKYYQPAGEWRGLCNNRQWYEEIKPAVAGPDFCSYAIRKGEKK